MNTECGLHLADAINPTIRRKNLILYIEHFVNSKLCHKFERKTHNTIQSPHQQEKESILNSEHFVNLKSWQHYEAKRTVPHYTNLPYTPFRRERAQDIGNPNLETFGLCNIL